MKTDAVNKLSCKHGIPLFQTCYWCGRFMIKQPEMPQKDWETIKKEIEWKVAKYDWGKEVLE